MLRRLLSILVILSMLLSTVPVFADKAQENSKILVNEVFDDYVTNDKPIPDKVDVSQGMSVVELSKSNKVLYANITNSPESVVVPLGTSECADRVVLSFDMLVMGAKINGSIFKVTSGSYLMNLRQTGKILLQDNYHASGYLNMWHNYSVELNYKTGKFNYYIDGKCIVADHMIQGEAIKQDSVKFTFVPSPNGEETQIYLDNIRFYESDKVLDDSFFPNKPFNNDSIEKVSIGQVSTEATIYIDSYADVGISASPNTGGAKTNFAGFSYVEGTGTKALTFRQDSNMNTFVDITPAVDENVTSFVYEFRVMPQEGASGTSAFLGRLIDNIGGYYELYRMSADGVITGAGVRITKAPYGKWTKISAVFDTIMETVDFYVNGKLVQENISVAGALKVPNRIRIGYISYSSGKGKGEYHMDCIKVYSGDKLIDFGDDERLKSIAVDLSDIKDGDLNLNSIMDSDVTAKALIGNKSVFMTCNNTYFANKEKQRYEKGKEAYLDQNGVTFVDASLVSKALGIAIALEGDVIVTPYGNAYVGKKETSKGDLLDASPVVKDGTLFIPATSFTTNLLGKYAYIDDTGFIMLSNDNDLKYDNKHGLTENLQPIDVIYRYVLYDNPTGDEIYDLIQKHASKTRPTIFKRYDEIASFRQMVNNDSEMHESAVKLIEQAERLIKEKPVIWNVPDGIRLLEACMNVRDRIFILAGANLLTGDTRYLDRMWEECKYALIQWPDWNQPGNVNDSREGHFLDTGKITAGMAVAYDMLYEYLPKSEIEIFKKGMEEKCINYFVNVFNGTAGFNGRDSRTALSNWGAVVGGGMFMSAISLLASEEKDSELAIKCKFIAENALKMLQYPIGHFYPDGALTEGLGYYVYYVEYVSWSILTMKNMCGTDFGFLSTKGYSDAPDYLLYIQSLYGEYNHSESGGTGGNYTWTDVLFLLSKLTGNQSQMQVSDVWRSALGKDYSIYGLLWYEPQEINVSIDNYPLDKLFKGENVQIMKGGWDNPVSTYVGVRGGINTPTGSHFDKGSFIYESDGIRWFIDLGTDNYNVDGGYFGADGYTLYRKRTEGHNNVVFSPSKDDPGQIPYMSASCVRTESKPKGAISVYDLSDVYGPSKVNKYKRGFYLGDDRYSLVVQDEIELSNDYTDFYHFLHTEDAQITINEDGKSAKIVKNGETMHVSVICDASDWHLEVMDAKYLIDGMQRQKENDRSKIKKLAIVGCDSGSLNISVKFTVEGKGRNYSPHTFTPIDTWKIPDGVVAPYPRLETVSINGELLETFSPSKPSYNIVMLSNEKIAQLSASCAPDMTITEIKQPQSYEDSGYIVVKNADGLIVKYFFTFKYPSFTVDGIIDGLEIVEGMPTGVEMPKPSDVTASYIPQPENPPASAVDSDITTYWASNEAGEYLTVDLGQASDLIGIAFSWMHPQSRNYAFDIEVSDDGTSYTKIFSGKSIASKSEYQFLAFSKKTRFVRYVGYGNNQNAWNSLAEFRPCVKK